MMDHPEDSCKSLWSVLYIVVLQRKVHIYSALVLALQSASYATGHLKLEASAMYCRRRQLREQLRRQRSRRQRRQRGAG